MSDLKIGDLAKVYGPDYGYDPADWDGEIGVVNAIREEKVIDVYINEYLCTFHRKQCRKLVKAKKCDECEGRGEWKILEEEVLKKVKCICRKCNGKGKVKI